MTRLSLFEQVEKRHNLKTIRNDIDAPEWHIDWFSKHYSVWLSITDPKKITFFYGTYIEREFADYLRKLGYHVVLRSPLDSDEYLAVYVSLEEYTMEMLRIESDEN